MPELMTVTRGAESWELPVGCRRVGPTRRLPALRRQVAADLAEHGAELWAGRGIWILAPGAAAHHVDTYRGAEHWLAGWRAGLGAGVRAAQERLR